MPCESADAGEPAKVSADRTSGVAEASRYSDDYIKATLVSAEEDLARERFERRDDPRIPNMN